MIHFMWPYAFLFLLAPFCVYFIMPRAKRTPSAAALRVPFFARLQKIHPTTTQSVILKTALILSWILFTISAARPIYTDLNTHVIPQSGRNIFIAIDTSGSMAEADMTLNGLPATRFETIKNIVRTFIQNRTGDNIGLILFASEAYTFTPMTLDTKTTALLFDEAAIGIAGDMTAIGDAITLAVQNLTSTPADKRVLILLSDGRQNAGKTSIADAISLAQQNTVKIYTIGIGAEPTENFMGTTLDLDEQTLSQIANDTGGIYFRARSTTDLNRIYNDLNKIEPTIQNTNANHVQKEIFYFPLAMALLLFFVVFRGNKR